MNRVPVATYRIQFTRDFRFRDGEELVPYLHQLGISDLYSSPQFRPRRGSSHGYDVTSPRRINPDLGTEDDFNDLSKKLQAYDMGLLLDIVPNHMAASHENAWWQDVLEHGPASRYADFFDIDWHPKTGKAALLESGRVLVPVLGEMYGETLAAAKLSLGLEERGVNLTYYERRFPIDTGTCAALLDWCAARVEAESLAETAAELRELSRLCGAIPGREQVTPESAAARAAVCSDIDRQLFVLYRDNAEARRAIDRALGEFAGDPAKMNALLERQAYRLAHWRIASDEINYRRFFDINDLVSLRVELAHVFEARHTAILELVRSGSVTGLRVDHVDGLYDPLEYLNRLQAAAAGDGRMYVVVEKILGSSECLPQEWPIAGTTGYDFLNVVNDLLIDAQGCEALERWHREATGDRLEFAELGYQCNRLVMRRLFAGEVERLTYELAEIAARHWTARDIPVPELRRTIVEVSACLPVYRTYADDRGLDAQSRRVLEETLDLAKERMGAAANIPGNIDAWNFVREVLLVEPPAYDASLGAAYLAYLRRWQQFTGPLMAKGLEDTAFYRDSSLLSRNEVGGDSLRQTPPRGPDQVHEFLAHRQRHHPHSLNATSTHDTKRSEDARARIDVLSEIPEEWTRICGRWMKMNRPLRSVVAGQTVPSADEEIRLYQTLLGTWPLNDADLAGYAERVRQFLRKACREAKLHSDWLTPNEPYEEALLRFATALMEGDPKAAFARSFRTVLRRIAMHGAWNSLSQLLIKIAAPGIPDFYQGMETWALQMVDPDNRGPVDHGRHREMLASLAGNRKAVRGLVRNWQDGRIKMFVTATALNFRREHAELFAEGEYIPLRTRGEKAECAFAFTRRKGAAFALVIAQRLTMRLATGWANTEIELPAGAPSEWRNVFTGAAVSDGRTIRVSDALDEFPAGLLENAG